MKSKSLLLPVLIGLAFSGLIVLNILDLSDVLGGKGDYPFGSEFFGRHSIYGSKGTYIFYNVVFILFLITTMILGLKKRWKAFCFLLALDFFLFLYPLITNT